MVQPAAPRQLPAQDPATVDAAERSARTTTYGVGILAGAIVLILMFVVCARVIS